MSQFHTIKLLIASLLLNSYCLQAQVEWAPIGATWHYTYDNYPGVVEYLKLEASKDTVMAGVDAKVLSQTIYREDGQVDNLLGNLYIHQDGNQLYLWIRGRFELLYDFDAQVGDTLKLLAPMDTIYYPERDSLIYLRVDSIKDFDIGGQEIRGQYLEPIYNEAFGYAVQFSGWNIEGIGNQYYFIAWNQLDCDGECADEFRCYQDNAISYQAVDYPCDKIVPRLVSTRESATQQHKIQVYQNPIMSGSTLTFSVHTNSTGGTDTGLMTYEICDLRGRRMVPLAKIADHQESVSTFMFTPGVYFLIVRSRDGIAQERIVIY